MKDKREDLDWLDSIIETLDYTYELNEPTEEEKRAKLAHSRKVNRRQAANYRRRHPDKIKARARRYKKRNPDKDRIHKAKARAGALDESENFTVEDVELQYKSQKGLCWWCSQPVSDKYHVDHVVPLARDGSNKPRNIVISCPTCNLKKKDKLPHEWIGRLF